ncbi:hypothetical protein HYU21_03205, partial [Candidatus Woesearchaeota archaeon]|nr:hypothetical protein [Candidatus Woesearchaeota archaeon]
DFHSGVVRVMGKGAKEREVPFGAAARQALWNYMIRRGGLSSIGRGIFTREIEDALLRDEVDLAVHSAKDLETELSKGLAIGASAIAAAKPN